MRPRAILCVGLLLLLLPMSQDGHALQWRPQGRVVDRNGTPQQQCQVDFYLGEEQPQYRVYSDPNGYFYLENPQEATYSVTVSQGDRWQQFSVTITQQYGLSPSVLAVGW